jgi:hypothetical protein
MLAAPGPLGSASRDRVDAERDSLRRVPACNFRRHAGKTLFGETLNTTREDAYAPRPIATPVLSTIPLQVHERRPGRNYLSALSRNKAEVFGHSQRPLPGRHAFSENSY